NDTRVQTKQRYLSMTRTRPIGTDRTAPPTRSGLAGPGEADLRRAGVGRHADPVLVLHLEAQFEAVGVLGEALHQGVAHEGSVEPGAEGGEPEGWRVHRPVDEEGGPHAQQGAGG